MKLSIILFLIAIFFVGVGVIGVRVSAELPQPNSDVYISHNIHQQDNQQTHDNTAGSLMAISLKSMNAENETSSALLMSIAFGLTVLTIVALLEEYIKT